MQAFFDLEHTVTEGDIDEQQHVSNLRYLTWALAAAGKHTDSLGHDSKGELERGFGFVVRKHEITYRVAAVLGDEIHVRTWIEEADQHSAWRRSLVCRPSTRSVLATVRTRWVYINLRSHQLASIPAEVADQAVVLKQRPPMPWESA